MTTNTPEQDPFAIAPETPEAPENILEELVGEGKKFQTPEDLAKGKYHADLTIEALKKKNDELLQDLKGRQSVEEIYTRLQEDLKPKQTQEQVTAPSTPAEQNNAPAEPVDVQALVAEELRKAQAEQVKQQNIANVAAKLRENGVPADKQIQDASARLGVSVDYLKDVAGQNPTVFFTLVGEPAAPAVAPTLPKSTVQTQVAPNGNPSGAKTESYYQKMKQTDPAKYFDNKTTVQMMKDAEALGDSFFDI